MANVPKPNIVWRGAHPSNFTVGRPGASRDGRNSFHHVVGSAESAVIVFNNGSRGASSHLVITDRKDIAAYQCVDFNNTAWTDGNFESNVRSITMEHHGDWRNGYYNAQVIENSARVVAWLRQNYGVTRAIRHRDVSIKPTACPADLPVEKIWNRSTEIINSYKTPVDTRPQWLKDRKPASGTVFSQKAGVFLRNLNDPSKPVDSRRFVLNQSFEIGSTTVIGGKKYYITKSSTSTNAPNGLLEGEVKTTPYVAPKPVPVEPPKPTTPDWADSLLEDYDNTTLYVLRATPLIDLENGHPYVTKEGKEIWYQAGDIVENMSAKTIVANTTYELTEYSFGEIGKGNWKAANGIKAADLTIDPKATPIGTPANPAPVPEPEDPIEPMPDVPTPDNGTVDKNVVILFLESLIKIVSDFITKLKGNK